MHRLILVTSAAVFLIGSNAMASTPFGATDEFAKNDKPQCDVVSPSKPCKGNNGFGNGGNDGSPNGKQDDNR